VLGKEWVPGDPKWGAIHRGRTYLFKGPAEQERFLKEPDRYSPVISGNDPVVALKDGRMVAGQRQFGVFYEGRVYLFSSEESLAQFEKQPDRYSQRILQAARTRSKRSGARR
jgi:YHS domain-containing protein